MTYMKKYGNYAIYMGGLAFKWFKTFENAKKEFDFYAQYPDELEDDMTLVNIRTSEVLESCEAEG